MEIQTEHDDLPVKRTTLPPPDYNSRGMKVKLLVLVGALMFVLITMNEARKPKNWSWMGFDKDGKQTQKEPSKKFIIREEQYEPRNSPQDSQEKILPQNSIPNDTSAEVASKNVSSVNSETLPQVEFWKRLFRQLDLSEQRGLFSLLREFRGRSFENERPFDRQPLTEKMDQLVKTRLSEMLNDLSLIEEGVPRRVALNDQIQQLQSQWEVNLLPVLKGEAEPTFAQMKSIFALQNVMDEAAYSVVSDKSAPTWASDDPAWLRTWERILNVSRDVNAQPVSPIQLKAEPKFYRGKPILMSGELRGIERLNTANNPMGIKQYFSAWIRPEKNSIQPFNVYLTHLPESIVLSEDRFTAFEAIQVSVTGAFFKVRTYKDASGMVSQTPLVFARTFTTVELETTMSDNDLPVRGGWTPSTPVLISFLVGMPLLAIGLAIWVYRGTKANPYQPGEKVTQSINQSLDALGQDPSVKTVSEKLAKMQQDGAME